MTDLPAYAEMRAMADKRTEDEREAEERDGFVVEEWSEDGDVWGCLGHVDKAKFLAQVQQRYARDGYITSQDATHDLVEHRYVLVDPADDAEYLYRWSVVTAVETTPPIPEHVRLRAVTADDLGAEPVTMLDL